MYSIPKSSDVVSSKNRMSEIKLKERRMSDKKELKNISHHINNKNNNNDQIVYENEEEAQTSNNNLSKKQTKPIEGCTNKFFEKGDQSEENKNDDDDNDKENEYNRIHKLIERASETIVRERRKNTELSEKISTIYEELLILYQNVVDCEKEKEFCRTKSMNVNNFEREIVKIIKIIDNKFESTKINSRIIKEQKEKNDDKEVITYNLEKEKKKISNNNDINEIINDEKELHEERMLKSKSFKTRSDQEKNVASYNLDKWEFPNKEIINIIDKSKQQLRNSRVTAGMLKRLQQSLAPKPKKEYIDEIINVMVTELEKDINNINASCLHKEKVKTKMQLEEHKAKNEN